MHATVYAVVISILTLVNILVVPQFYWFEFPMLGWGLGLFMHYTFGYRKASEQITRHQGLATATLSCGSEPVVDLAAVAQRDHEDDQLAVADLVDDAVVPHADPQQGPVAL